MRRRLLAALLAIAGAAAAINAAPAAPADPAAGDPFADLKVRLVGPAAGGRVSRVTGVAGDPRVYYAATAAGGVWKSEDGGLTWKSVFDDQPTHSIGSIAVAPSDPNVVYVGSGEANIRGNVAAGAGIFKSTDAGKTWTHVWKQRGQIGAMAVHPTNPDVAFAAVLGHAFGPNAERGVYRTHDGGASWQQVLARDADTGASDVAIDPANPRTVFAGFWQARRRPWELTSGGPGSGLHVSRDGGDTWSELRAGTGGLPAGPWGKVGVRVAPSRPRRVYALIEAAEGGLFRSDDGGESWKLVNPSRGLRQRAWYYTTLTVDPRQADVVWFPQVSMLKTVDGGATLRPVKGGGWDYHDLWIDPVDPRRMISGSDAGVAVSSNGGESWHRPPLAISQFYHLTTDERRPYWIYGTLQDYGTVAGPSDSLHSSGIPIADWQWVGGGEAGHVALDPSQPDVVYAGEYLGYISRFDWRTRQARNVSAYPENASGHGIGDLDYRFQWTAPILVSRHEPGVVYHGANVLFRSRDGGLNWDAVSPDLSRDDESKQRWSGGPITGDNTGVEFYGTIFALAESPREAGVLWAGSDDGLVHVTRDGGKSWKSVTPKGIPDWATVATIEPSRAAGGTAYVVVDAHRLDDRRPYLFRTTDYGASWTSLAAGLPGDDYLHVLREDPTDPRLLWLGSERGVSLSRDAGRTWRRLKLGLPTVAVHDLVVRADDLVIGTMGRSAWVFDDLAPIRQWSAEVAARPLHLFAPHAATRWREHESRADKDCCGNPPRGAILDYWLKAHPKGELQLEIRDAAGRLVRTLTSTAEPPTVPPEHPDADPDQKEPEPALDAEPGLHRAVWDLRWQAPHRVPGAMVDWGDVTEGPLAVPGRYTVRLTADGRSVEQTLTVEPDPRATIPPADLEAQLAFALEMRDTFSWLTATILRLRGLREQLTARAAHLPAGARAGELRAAIGGLVGRLDALERQLHNPAAEVSYDILAGREGGAQLYSRLSPLYSFVNDGDGLPTQGVRQVFAAQRAEVEAGARQLDELVARELPRIGQLATAAGVGFVAAPVEP